MSHRPLVTAPSLSVPAGTLSAAWQQLRVVLPPRALAGGGIVLAVIAASHLINGSRVAIDPALPLVVAVGGAALLGGLRGAAVAGTLAVIYGLYFYAQPHSANVAGNGLRVLLYLAGVGLGAYLVGAQRERLDRLVGGFGPTNGIVERVRQFSAALNESRADALGTTIVTRSAALLGADMAALTVIDLRTGRHIVRAVHGTSPSAVGVEVLPGVGLAGQALRDHRTVVVGRPVAPPTIYGFVRGQIARWLGGDPLAPPEPSPPRPAPAIALPAINAGSVVATLTLGRADVNRPFTEQERQALDLIAPQIGLAVINALIRGQLREASLIDTLTGLYNRAYLDAALDQLLALRRRMPAAQRPALSLIMFDIDGFRALNETHGQAVADQVLRTMAALLRQRFRASDTIARVGGDGFVVVLDGATQEAAVEAAGQLRAQVRDLALTDERGAPLTVSISAGVALFRDDAVRSETVLRTVEAALDTARWSGPASVVAI